MSNEDGTIKTIRMRDNDTGEERSLTPRDGARSWFGPFIWTDGNFACDCNRELFWFDWGPEAIDRECGSVKYRVIDITLEDGRVIEIDAP